MIKALYRPNLEDVLKEVQNWPRQKDTLIIVGECEVEYEGRGYSRLASGERIVLVKTDGSVIVHRPYGFQPVNYQPDTDSIESWIEPDGRLSIIAVRDKPREALKITFSRVEVFIRQKLVDRGDFIMYFDEGELRDYIFENPGVLGEGVEALAREVRTSAGVIDILAKDSAGRYMVVEVKRGTATRDAVYQLYKYVVSVEKEKGCKPRGVLVAPSFTPAALDSLRRLGLEWRYIDPKRVLEYLKKRGRVGGLFKYVGR
ncbi:MAG: endonuclease NucS [Thermogladius sp.]|nr:endonuclease NucS [Thermogladius sp.]